MSDYFPEKPGNVKPYGGFFTKALYFRSQSSKEIESRVGYREGRLRDGFWLLFLTRLPSVNQFQFRGYSQMSGGVPMGHKAEHKNDMNAEQRLVTSGANLTGTSYQKVGLKQRIINDTFKIKGPDRLAKVLPIAREHGDKDIPDYPPGTGIPQWTLTEPLPWIAAAFIGPGETYTGMYEG